MPTPVKRIDPLVVQNWGQVVRGEVRFTVDLPQQGRLAVVSTLDLDQLMDAERKAEHLNWPWSSEGQHCLECGLSHFNGPYLVPPTAGCSMCEVWAPNSLRSDKQRK